MVRRDIMISILDQVKIFDQEIGASRLVTEQFLYLLKRVGLELASLGKGPGPLARADMTGRPARPTAAILGFFLHAYSLSSRPRLHRFAQPCGERASQRELG